MGCHGDGDGCTAPEEYLPRGYAFTGDDGCITAARHHALALLDRAHTGHLLPVSVRARGTSLIW